MRLHPNRLVKICIGVALLASCGGSATPLSSDAATATTAAATTTLPPTTARGTLPPADYDGFRSQPTACGAVPPPATTPSQYTEPDDLVLDPAVKLRATITTSCGPIVVELDPAMAPATVNSFVFLANEGYFNGTVAHRIIPGFVIQAGDPTATGRGGPGYVIPDEPPPDGFAYSTGVLAMANAGPNSTGSQFFIMVGNSGLPPLYSAFGIVVDGFDTLESLVSLPLGLTPRGELSVPLETVYIEAVVVEPAG